MTCQSHLSDVLLVNGDVSILRAVSESEGWRQKKKPTDLREINKHISS